MHVAIVCERLTPHDDVAGQARLLGHAFAALGHRVTLIAAVGLDTSPHERIEVRAYNFRWWRIAPGLPGFRRWVRASLASLKPDYTVSMTTLICADVVIPSAGTASAYAGALRAMPGPPPVRVRAWAGSLSPAQLLRQVWENRVLASPSVKAVVADNGLIDAELQSLKHVDQARLKRIAPAVSAQPIDPEQAQLLRRKLARGLGMDEDAAWLVFPFRSAWLDGFEPLMLAFKALIARGGKATLLLAGPTRYTHLAWIAQLGLREHVRLIGRPDHPDQLLAAADLLVQPTRHDPGGVWPLAAVAMGLPVLTTNASGAAESIGPDDGTVLPGPVKPDRLAEALGTAVESALRARKEGSTGGRGSDARLDPGDRVQAILALLGTGPAPAAAEGR